MSKKYLVTGGTGFIGAGVVARMLKDGAQIRILDNNSRGRMRRIESVLDKVEMIEGDIRDPNVVMRACEGMDSIIHLAYVNGTEYFYTKPDLVLDVGVKGMVNVIDACIHHKIKELVLASSSEVYQTPARVPTDESATLVVPDPLNPRYSYGGGKIICELMAINYGRVHFDRVLIFRPHNVYGPDMGFEHVVPQFAVRVARTGKDAQKGTILPFPIQGTGEEKRSFIYIDDFAEGFNQILQKGKHLGIYHIGTMDEYSIRDVAQMVAQSLDYNVEIVPGPLRPGGTLRRCPDITKLRGLGFDPKVTLSEGLKRTAKWYADHVDEAPAN
jgi:nucleoside-diphosphate-sugar epimerase